MTPSREDIINPVRKTTSGYWHFDVTYFSVLISYAWQGTLHHQNLSVRWRTTTKLKESWEIKKHPLENRMRKSKENICLKMYFSRDHWALPSDLILLSLFFSRAGNSFHGVSHNPFPSSLWHSAKIFLKFLTLQGRLKIILMIWCHKLSLSF